MATYEDIQKANEQMIPMDIKGRPYMEVNQRIKAFRMCYPMGYIKTEMLSNENGVCIFKAVVGVGETVLGIGHAYEKENSTFINKTSYIENAETSSVGRALGMAGFGIDTSVASAEEVQNAIMNQENTADEKKATPKQIEVLAKTYTGENLIKLLEFNKVSKLEELSMKKASELISKLKGEK